MIPSSIKSLFVISETESADRRAVTRNVIVEDMAVQFFVHIELHVIRHLEGKADVIRRHAERRERDFIDQRVFAAVYFRLARFCPVESAFAAFFDGRLSVFARMAVDDIIKSRKRRFRIAGGDQPLDGTSINPESYEAAGKLLHDLGYGLEWIAQSGPKIIKIQDYKKMADRIGVGEPTLRDMVKELCKPGRDPREDMPKPVLRSDVLEMKDLKEGMILKGTVRNVIDFGAFVDIGVHQDGLVHISQMSDKYIRHPLEAVSVGDVVEVKVLGVDPVKKRISLTMKL